MGRHKTDKGDAARYGNDGCRERDGSKQQGGPLLLNRDADADGDAFAHAEQVQAVGLIQHERNEEDQPRENGADKWPIRSPDASGQPFRDEIDLDPFRGRDDHNHDAGQRQGESYADQHEPYGLQAGFAAVRQQVDQTGGNQGACKSDDRQQINERSGINRDEQKENGNGDAGAGIDPDNTRIGEVVAGNALENRAGQGQSHPRQESDDNSRQPDGEQDKILLERALPKQCGNQPVV